MGLEINEFELNELYNVNCSGTGTDFPVCSNCNIFSQKAKGSNMVIRPSSSHQIH